jgi:hypothetical protein
MREHDRVGEAQQTMNLKRTATIAVGGGALVAWFAGAATSNRAPVAPVVTSVAPVDASGAELANEIARLQEKLRPTTPPRQPGRNLFTYHAPAPPAAAPAPKPALSEAAAVFTPPVPALKLAGIAEDADASGAPTRTAIISGEGQLFMVKEGENVTTRYRVAKISADVVELLDLEMNTPRRLALR